MRTTALQTNFTGGEFSPRLRGRVDIARYANAAEEITNFIVMVQGGLRRAYGSLFIAAAKNSNRVARLIPFVVSRSEAYVLEVGHQYIRVFKDRAQITSGGPAYELVTPYDESILREITWVQGQDSMFMAHEDTPMQRVRHFAAATWDISAAPWVVPPYEEQDQVGNRTCTLSATTVGTGRTFTLSGGGVGAIVFEAADVGRELIEVNGAGRATITAWTSTTQVTGDITVAFSASPLTTGLWALTESPKTQVTPSVSGPVGAAITLTAAAAAWRNQNITGYVQINGGLVKITGLTSNLIANGVVLRELTGTTAAPSEGWSQAFDVWGDTNYPRSVMLHEQRLFVGGSPKYPQTIWASGVGLYLDFTRGTADGDAFTFEIGSDQVNQIQHLVSHDALVILTNGGEFTAYGGTDKAISATNVQIKPRTPHGCDLARPVRVDREVLFVQRAAKKLRALGYRVDVDGMTSNDISLLAQHLTAAGIVEVAYQREPDPVLWVVLEDGRLLALTYALEQEVMAWTRRVTDGAYESVCVVPTDDGEDVYVIVRRTINGSTVRYVEVMDPDVNVDCGVLGTSGPGAATWAGLSHLEGEIVDVVADGVVMSAATVAGGQITLVRNANDVQIGLPYDSKVKLLPVEFAQFSAQGNQVRVGDVYVRLLETTGCTIEGEVVPFRSFGDSLLDAPIEPFTGDKEVLALGWERSGGQVTIEQTQPLPCHVLAVIRRVTVNNG